MAGRELRTIRQGLRTVGPARGEASCLPPASLRLYFSAARQSPGGCSPVAFVNISLMSLYSAGVPPCQSPFEQLATLQSPPWVLNASLSYVIGQVQCAVDGSY